MSVALSHGITPVIFVRFGTYPLKVILLVRVSWHYERPIMLLHTWIPLGFILNKIKVELIIVAIYTTVIGIIDESKLADISIPIAVPTIMGTAISLLLGFRTNQGYERWWEARIVWGAVVNDSRTLLRQVLTFINDKQLAEPATQELVQRMAHRQIAFCYALGQSLRELDTTETIQRLLPPDEQPLVLRHTNRPNALLLAHGNTLKVLLETQRVNAFQQTQLDSTIVRLCDSMGKCERIKNTVFPTMYSLIIHVFLYLFVLLLPFGLVNYFELSEIPIIIAIAALFFLIEKTAMYLQDPFDNKPTDTPVTAIARTIEINLRQMLAEAEVPEKLEAEGFYLM